MTDLEKLQEENKHLKSVLEEVYEMSCLDDMIDEWRSGADDEMLLCYLSLKSQIIDALGKRKLAKELSSRITEAPKMAVVTKLKHNSSKTTDHYSKEDK